MSNQNQTFMIPRKIRPTFTKWLNLIIDDNLFAPLVRDYDQLRKNVKNSRISVGEFESLRYWFHKTHQIAKDFGDFFLLKMFRHLEPFFSTPQAAVLVLIEEVPA